ncbi:MAG: hypothetical protein ACO1NX_11125 [Chitinophagaceae bacterium]
MRNRILIALFLFWCNAAQAQYKETIELQPGTTILEALQGEVYLYPQYKEGVVQFKNGRQGKGRLNYCFMSDEMLFISPNKDTLALYNVAEISRISIGADTFYTHGKNFIKQLHHYGMLKTAAAKSIKEKGRKKVGSYGETVDGVAVSLTSIDVASRFVDLASTDKIILQKETRYFIANEANEFVPLNKNNLQRLLPAGQQGAAQSYLKEKNVDFNKREQVHEMLLQLLLPNATRNL